LYPVGAFAASAVCGKNAANYSFYISLFLLVYFMSTIAGEWTGAAICNAVTPGRKFRDQGCGRTELLQKRTGMLKNETL